MQQASGIPFGTRWEHTALAALACLSNSLNGQFANCMSTTMPFFYSVKYVAMLVGLTYPVLQYCTWCLITVAFTSILACAAKLHVG